MFSGRHISEIISTFEKRSRSTDRGDIFLSGQRVKTPTKSSAPVAFRRPPTPGTELSKRPSSMVLLDTDSTSTYVQKYLEALSAEANKFSHENKATSPKESPTSKKLPTQIDSYDPTGNNDNLSADRFQLQADKPLFEGENERFHVSMPNENLFPFQNGSSEKAMVTNSSRKSSSSSESSASSASRPDDMVPTSNNSVAAGKHTGITAIPPPPVPPPDIPGLEEKLIESGHYQTPKSSIAVANVNHLSKEMSVEVPSRNEMSATNGSSIIQQTTQESFLSENVEKCQVFDYSSVRHSSDLESDEDGPTSYDVSVFTFLTAAIVHSTHALHIEYVFLFCYAIKPELL